MSTHPGDLNTTCAVPNSVDGGACIFARARPRSSLSGLTIRRSKTNGTSPSLLGFLSQSTSDGCPTTVFDWTVIFRALPVAATLERKKKVNSRKLKSKPSIGGHDHVNISCILTTVGVVALAI